MTLKLLHGFETIATDSDARLQGWSHPPALGLNYVGGINSITATAGTSLKLIGSYTGASVNPGVSTQADFGWCSTGVTVNQAWLAGGFSFGCAAKFNQALPFQVISQSTNPTYGIPQFAFDGTYYWAFTNTNGTYGVAYSPNLYSWTNVTIPAAVSTVLATAKTGSLQYLGNGVIALTSSNMTTGASVSSVYTTSNLGVTWTPTTAGLQTYGTALVAYGNATTPLVVFAGNAGATNTGIFVGTIGTTLTKVAGVLATNATILWAGVINGYVIALDGVGNMISALQTSNLALPASWSVSAIYATFACNGIAYANGVWMVGFFGTGGIWTTTATQPNGSTVWTQSLTGTYSHQLATNGTTTICTGGPNVASLYITTNGTTWTLMNTDLLASLDVNTNPIYDGTNFIMASIWYGMVLKSKNGINWTLVYAVDLIEDTFNIYYSTLGIVTGTALNAAAGTFNYTSSLGISPSGIGGGNRAMYCAYNNVLSAVGAVSNTIKYAGATPGYNYFEIVGIATKVANTFNVYILMNGAVLGNIQSNLLLGSTTTDVTSMMMLNLPRAGQFVIVDDMYFSTMTGNNAGPLGPVNIQLLPPSTDVSDQWTKDGAEASNAAAVLATSIASATGYVSTSTIGNKDIYNTTGGISLSVNKVAAMQIEAFVASNGVSAVTMGFVSNSAEADGAAIPLSSSTAVYAKTIIENDPNTSGMWTAASANAAKTAITKTA